MKQKKCRIIILSALTLAISACDRQNPEAILSSADDAVSISDYRSAQSLCDNLADITRSDSLALYPTQYCRLAMIYMTLAEHPTGTPASPDDNISSASAMFNCAVKISADSVRYFLENLSPEESSHAELLLQLSEAAEARQMIYGEFEQSDSTSTHSHDHEI